jgi:hypothetical protein
VHFINDEYLVTATGWKILDILPQFPNILYTGIGSAVDFKDVNGIARCYLFAGRTDIAGLGSRPLLTLKGLGENARSTRLTNTPGAGKQKRMGDPAGLDGILQCPAHMFLTDKVTERLRPPFSR